MFRTIVSEVSLKENLYFITSQSLEHLKVHITFRSNSTVTYLSNLAKEVLAILQFILFIGIGSLGISSKLNIQN